MTKKSLACLALVAAAARFAAADENPLSPDRYLIKKEGEAPAASSQERDLLNSGGDALIDADATGNSGSGVVDQPDFLKKFEDFRKALPFDIHGGAWLWMYLPDVDGKHYKNNFELYFAWLDLDVKVEDKSLGTFAFHIEPRFADDKLRGFFGSNFWVQEVFVAWKNPWADIGTVKVGKMYTRFGPFWDAGSFYGSIPYFDGIMLDPDFGVSLENDVHSEGKSFGIEYEAQAFLNDGRTNGSLVGRDTLSIGVRQRNEVVLRAAPYVKVGDKGRIGVGASFQHFDVDLVNEAGVHDEHVTRWNGEISAGYGPFNIFGTFTWQRGSQAPDYPVAGNPAEHRCYVLAGASLTPVKWLTLYYDYSYVHYASGNHIEEHMHQPGFSISIIDNIQFVTEYVWWYQKTPGHATTLDSSVNLMLYIHF